MRDRYEPDGHYQDPATQFDEPPAATRDDGLRRLSRLTWRTTQLSALAAATFAIVFARTAPTQAASSSPVPAQPGGVQSAAATATPSPSSSTSPAAGKHATGSATPSPQPSATAPAAKPSSAPPPPTLAPPTTPPAPAPAPSPVQSTSSGSHGG